MNIERYNELKKLAFDEIGLKVNKELDKILANYSVFNVSRLYARLLKFNEEIERIFDLKLESDGTLSIYRPGISLGNSLVKRVSYIDGKFEISNDYTVKGFCTSSLREAEEFLVRVFMPLPSYEDVLSESIKLNFGKEKKYLQFKDLKYGDRFRFVKLDNDCNMIPDNMFYTKVKMSDNDGFMSEDSYVFSIGDNYFSYGNDSYVIEDLGE